MKPDLDTFKTYCQRGDLVPVYHEYLADTETPVSVFNRFADDDRCFLLESVEGGERWGRYSFIGVHPYALFTVEDGQGMLEEGGIKRPVGKADEGIMALRDIVNTYTAVPNPDLPRFFGGAVGGMNYETINEFERLPAPKRAPDGPTSCFMLTDTMIIFDNVRHTMKIVACAHTDRFGSPEEAYAHAVGQIEAIAARLRENGRRPMRPTAGSVKPLQSNMPREQYKAIVSKAKEYISEGEVIQTVLSQRFRTELPASPMTLYRALRLINPSPYTFFLKIGEKILVGSSPEVMIRLTGDRAELRPIAGTRPRGGTEQEDRALADELLKDEKERAEHVMLVDLGRNDLGRVATPASVQVRDFMTIERYSHVMHIVSTVQAQLQADKDAFDLIKAVFPAGTLSGAPKIRAMEIINELEPEPRGAYGGAVGYIGFDGNMDLAITIRTLEIDGNSVAVQAGAGIVFDSDPEKEYLETCHKSAGMVRALELAASGLDLEVLKGV